MDNIVFCIFGLLADDITCRVIALLNDDVRGCVGNIVFCIIGLLADDITCRVIALLNDNVRGCVIGPLVYDVTRCNTGPLVDDITGGILMDH